VQTDRLAHLARKRADRLTSRNRLSLWGRVREVGECRVFTGHLSEQGYGRIGFRGRVDYAHRVAWTFTRGEIPEGMCVLHSCDNPACINPDHLWLGTQGDNMHDKAAKGRARNQYTKV
jgi:HNH endonuclease